MKKIIVLSLLVIAGILFSGQIKRGFLSFLILVDSVRPPEKSVMGKVLPTPEIKDTSISSRGRRIRADLYIPRGRGHHTPLLLVHDANTAGKKDERVALLAADLARAGFLVLVPDFDSLKTFRLRLSDAEDMVQWFRDLTNHPRAAAGGCMLGIGFGGGPMLIAAADKRISSRVRTITCFGCYGDLRAVMQFGLTGAYDYGGQSGYLRPDRTMRWTFAYRNLDLLVSDADRELMGKIVEKQFRLETREAARLARDLGPDGSAVYLFLRNTDQARFAPLYENLPTAMRAYTRLLSPVRVAKSLKADFVLVHAMDDFAVPYTESLRIADTVGDPDRTHVALLPQFMQREASASSVTDLYQRYGVGGWRLFSAIYRVLERNRI